jgi:hypothetical protein
MVDPLGCGVWGSTQPAPGIANPEFLPPRQTRLGNACELRATSVD